MHFSLSLFLLAPLAFAAPAPGVEECGSHRSDDEIRGAQLRYATYANRTSRVAGGGDHGGGHKPPKPPKGCGAIDVYWHVIYEDKTEANGYTPQKQIEDSIDALNDAFRPAGYSFNLKDTDRIKNAVWWNSAYGSSDQAAMKTALRKGDEKVLNVWTSSIPGLRGYATFPDDYDLSPTLDGVVVEPSTLVGGSQIGYNIGVTLIHEVGHWAGLWHTFQGGCSVPGDEVADTPQEAGPSSSCDVTQDTCPGDPGNDPVKNYMDYSPHTCKDHFTPGQHTRMHDQMRMFRGLEPNP